MAQTRESATLEGDAGNAAVRDVPAAFVQDVLVKLAPRILAGGDSLQLDDAPTLAVSGPPSLHSVRCSFNPPPQLPEGYAIPPTHLLSLAFERGNPTEPERLLVPIHQTVWASRCAHIAQLISDHERRSSLDVDDRRHTASEDRSESGRAASGHVSLTLPVVSFPRSLPSAALSTFTLLHTYLHTSELPAHLPSPHSRPDDAVPDEMMASSDQTEDDEEDHPTLATRARQCEALWKMCRGFGLANSEPIYTWLAPKWPGARSKPSKPARRRRRRKLPPSRHHAAPTSESETTAWSYLPTPPPS